MREGDIADTSYLWALLYQHGAELVLSGHHHHYERFTRMDANGNADPATGDAGDHRGHGWA